MCGICCIFGPADNGILKEKEHLVSSSRIGNRGPDACKWESICLSNQTVAAFCGYILHLRGQQTPQPLTDTLGNLLLWNGEVFGGLSPLKEDDNDTQVLLDQLASCNDDEQLVSLFSHLEGPWAFIYWQAEKQKLWFGRDVFGRRSLLWHLPESTDDAFILSSVRIGVQDFTELPSLGIFCLKSETTNHWPDQLTLYPWLNTVWPATGEFIDKDLESKTADLLSHCSYLSLCISSFTPHTFLPSICKDLPPANYGLPQAETVDVNYLHTLWESNSELQQEAKKLIEILGESVYKRVFNQNKQYLQSEDPSNHCYRQDYSFATKSNLDQSLSKLSVSHESNTENPSNTETEKSSDHETLTPERVIIDGSDSVENIIHGNASVAILFSGGLDATVIAALADRYIPQDEPIDLLNVAFASNTDSNKKATNKKGKQLKSTGQQAKETKTCPFSVPDRLTGYAALKELNPNRRWNFIEVNITLKELQQTRTNHVADLLYPLCTVLDDSIGCAVWFAARGQGVLGNGPHKGHNYCSHAKVVLCGMGADELFAGYSRHRACFSKGGWEGLTDEMQVEINRISSRNLGRDDRIISDHGREARFPYLDEKVTNFIAQLPVYIKTDLSLTRGLGEKLLLRLCALSLGLPTTAIQPKRAIQFGSRIAKLENSKEKSSDVCMRLSIK